MSLRLRGIGRLMTKGQAMGSPLTNIVMHLLAIDELECRPKEDLRVRRRLRGTVVRGSAKGCRWLEGVRFEERLLGLGGRGMGRLR